jgi:hypothetical protein
MEVIGVGLETIPAIKRILLFRKPWIQMVKDKEILSLIGGKFQGSYGLYFILANTKLELMYQRLFIGLSLY